MFCFCCSLGLFACTTAAAAAVVLENAPKDGVPSFASSSGVASLSDEVPLHIVEEAVVVVLDPVAASDAAGYLLI